MKEAIKLAIEEGWNDRLYRNLRNPPENNKAGIQTHYRDCLLDLKFWQALGKKLRWGQTLTDISGYCLHCGVRTNIQPERSSGCRHVHYPEDCEVCSAKARTWEDQWHAFITHLINGKDIESFFNNLIDNK